MFCWTSSPIPRMAASVNQPPLGDDRNLVTVDENYLAPTFEDRLRLFWEKNSRVIVAVIVIAVLGILARYGFEWFAARREQAIRADYAVATSDEQLKSFIAANPKAPLAGVAQLRLADEAYTAGNYAAAREGYAAAASLLGNDPVGARARLGAAITPLIAGDAVAARPGLEALANDTTFPAPLRAEVAYHLAVIARDSAQPAESTRWAELVLSTDPEGLWAQRALQLRSSLPANAAPATSAEAATQSAPAAGDAAVSFPAAK